MASNFLDPFATCYIHFIVCIFSLEKDEDVHQLHGSSQNLSIEMWWLRILVGYIDAWSVSGSYILCKGNAFDMIKLEGKMYFISI